MILPILYRYMFARPFLHGSFVPHTDRDRTGAWSIWFGGSERLGSFLGGALEDLFLCPSLLLGMVMLCYANQM